MKLIGHFIIIIGLLGIIKNYKNNILILLSLELFFIGISLLYLDSSFQLDNFEGIITSIIILCISATESAIGLTILLISKKNPSSL